MVSLSLQFPKHTPLLNPHLKASIPDYSNPIYKPVPLGNTFSKQEVQLASLITYIAPIIQVVASPVLLHYSTY